MISPFNKIKSKYLFIDILGYAYRYSDMLKFCHNCSVKTRYNMSFIYNMLLNQDKE